MNGLRNRPRVTVIGAAISLLLTNTGCGVIGGACSGIAALLCGEGLYCKYEDGSCGDDGEFGACAARPEACAQVFAPVCGCDGHTYGNECQAAAAGVSIRTHSPCETDGLQPICGGIAGFLCQEGDFCKYGLGTCGSGDQSGVCMSVPTACGEIDPPVCGCDGVTYDNECESERAQTSVLHEGPCEADNGDVVCGGLAGLPCRAGEFCRMNLGECCCDFQGVCTRLPDVCAEVFAPVCGCDGVTYGNACEAQRAGMSIQSTGECP